MVWPENCRLVGTIDLEFECEPTHGLLKKLHAPVKSTRREIVGKAGNTHVVIWDCNGEPGSRDCYPVHRLLRGCHTGLLLPKESSTIPVLSALVDLSRPDEAAAVPWTAQPLLRAVCPRAGAQQGDKVLKVRVWVYFRRLLFEMISYPPLIAVMKAIVPASSVRKTATLPSLDDPQFISHLPSEVGPEYAYSMAGVMKAQEHSGYRKAQQPPGLKMQMKDYQRQTLAWMLDHEALPHGLNELFWEKWSFPDGNSEDFYYAPQLGELRLEQPLERRGGILSEEMGLGKTIEILALILATKDRQGAASAGSGGNGGLKANECHGVACRKEEEKVVAHGGTLIVVPVHLVSQWLFEIEKAAGGSLSVAKYTTENKLTRRCAIEVGGPKECAGWPGGCPGPEAHMRQRIQRLAASADVVITTYAMLKDDKATFNRIKWQRVVLDEMQEIRSSTTDHARACEKILCDCRWMVSGTPLYTSIDDLNGELAFLGVLPFCASDSVDGFWSMCISKPFKRRKPEALALLNCLLSGVMIRHSKSQTYTDGTSILDLPAYRTFRVPVEQSDSEKFLYRFLEINAVTDLGAVIGEQGPLGSGGANANFWLRVLREACVAPSLINGGAGVTTQTLRDVDYRLRAMGMGSIWQAPNGRAGGDQTSWYDPKSVRSLTPGDALKVLMQGRDVAETARHHRNNHMHRHQGEKQGTYDRNRSYAMPTIQERLVEVGEQRSVLYDRIKIARRDVPLLRWRWAVECITSGRYWDHSAPRRDAQSSEAEAAAADDAAQAAAAAILEDSFPLRFLRRAFDAVRLQRAYAVADQCLQHEDKQKGVVFEGIRLYDRARLRQSFEKAVPTGLRVLRVRAKMDYEPATAAELAFSKDDVISLVATTEAGWRALGFTSKQWPHKKLAPRSYFANENDEASGAEDEDYLLLGSITIVAEDPPPRICSQAILRQVASGGVKTLHELWDKLLSTAAAAAEREREQQRAAREQLKLDAADKKKAGGGATVTAAAAKARNDEKGRTLTATAAQKMNPFPSKNSMKQCLDFLRRNRRVLRDNSAAFVLGEQGFSEQEDENEEEDIKPFKVSGDIGVVHSRMVRALRGVGGRTSRVDIPSGRVANLREDQKKVLGEMMSEANQSRQKIADLDPFLRILKRAHAAGAGQSTEDTIQQSGFQQLYEIELGQRPKCCVCQDGCGYEQKPLYMRCAHFACEQCLLRWAMYERSKPQNQHLGHANALEATCPLCRKAFCLSDLIRIVKPPQAEVARAEGGSKVSDKGKEVASEDGKEFAQECPQSRTAPQRREGRVQWIPTATDDSLNQIPPPASGILARNSIIGLGNFPSFTPELGSHIVNSCGVNLAARAADPCPQRFSSKVQRLLADLAKVMAQQEKAVVFTQHKQAVLHLSRVFCEPGVGIGHVKIVGGDPQAAQERAVKLFNEDADVSVFLLHAGQAAAGLTLTAASHVFLMEPFMKAGEQAQAMNRCHRIGQTREVSCTLYYAPDTVEERMEAWKDCEVFISIVCERACLCRGYDSHACVFVAVERRPGSRGGCPQRARSRKTEHGVLDQDSVPARCIKSRLRGGDRRRACGCYGTRQLMRISCRGDAP